MTLLDTIQTLVMQVINTAQLTDMKTGTVTSVSPLEITTDVSQAPLREEVLIFATHVSEQYFTVIDGELCVIWGAESFALNDKVLLLAVQHGQKYIVLGRL